jgi:hypothetical protein
MSQDITGPNSTVGEACAFNTSILPSNSPVFPIQNSNLSLIWEFDTLSGPNNNTEVYDNATQNVLPPLFVLFPPANDNREASVSYGQGFMNCVRANSSTPGNRVAPPLPAPTALRKLPIKLSKGAIAGVVIGAVAMVAAIVGLMVLLCLRRRNVKRAAEEKAEAERKQRELEKARTRKRSRRRRSSRW